MYVVTGFIKYVLALIPSVVFPAAGARWFKKMRKINEEWKPFPRCTNPAKPRCKTSRNRNYARTSMRFDVAETDCTMHLTNKAARSCTWISDRKTCVRWPLMPNDSRYINTNRRPRWSPTQCRAPLWNSSKHLSGWTIMRPRHRSSQSPY